MKLFFRYIFWFNLLLSTINVAEAFAFDSPMSLVFAAINLFVAYVASRCLKAEIEEDKKGKKP